MTTSAQKDADATMRVSQFHLAFPVYDLDQARDFYVNTIGCTLGRENGNHIDLDMFDHHVVAHIAPPRAIESTPSDFDGHDVPVPHFGVNLDGETWEALSKRLQAARANFREFPHVRLEGKTGEHRTLFVIDPSGNALEFKTFNDHSEVFLINPEDTHVAPDDKTIIRPMVEAEVFRVCGKVEEGLASSGLLDSVGAIELVNGLQKAFGIDLRDAEMDHLQTVSSVVDMIAAKKTAT